MPSADQGDETPRDNKGLVTLVFLYIDLARFPPGLARAELEIDGAQGNVRVTAWRAEIYKAQGMR